MCLPMIGAVVSGIGALASGMQQAAQYKAQAKALKVQAQGERNVGSYEALRAQERGDLAVSKNITGMAAKGLDITTGTPQDVILDSATEVALDVGTIRANAQVQSNKTDYEAKIAKMNAKSAKTGAIIGAIAPVLSGVGSTFS